jgi:hypothetical protein
VGNIPLWYNIELSFTFTVALIIEVSSDILSQCYQGFSLKRCIAHTVAYIQ